MWARESGEPVVSEAAATADRVSLAFRAAPEWDWLASAAEMAADAGRASPLAPGPDALCWPGFPRVATRTPGTGPGSVRAARNFTGATLARWRIGERRDDIVTVVSELLTNALRYSAARSREWPSWPVRVGLVQPGPWVVCAVSDPSHLVPEPTSRGLLGESGRGLHVVASLCDEWGCTAPGPRGKAVWAMFMTSPSW
jgi:hypothetical protein